jgi:hypothetical protein
MSIRLTVRCDGQHHGQPCLVEHTTTFGMRRSRTRHDDRDDVTRALPRILERWRIADDGTDRCPADHDDEAQL